MTIDECISAQAPTTIQLANNMGLPLEPIKEIARWSYERNRK